MIYQVFLRSFSRDDAFIARRLVSDAQGVHHSAWIVANVRDVQVNVSLPASDECKEVWSNVPMPTSVQLAPFDVNVYASGQEG
jgi:hypothetical protein